jgi:hypothetical protein
MNENDQSEFCTLVIFSFEMRGIQPLPFSHFSGFIVAGARLPLQSTRCEKTTLSIKKR